MEIAVAIPIILILLRSLIAFLQIKIGRKDALIHKYILQDEKILAEGILVYISSLVLVVIDLTLGFFISLPFFIFNYHKIAFLILLYFIMFASFSLIKSFVNKKTSKLLLTNKRLILLYGTFSHKVIDFSIDSIANITLYKGFLGRIFDFSTVSFTSTTGAKLSLGLFDNLDLKNAEDFIKIFNEAKIQRSSDNTGGHVSM